MTALLETGPRSGAGRAPAVPPGPTPRRMVRDVPAIVRDPLGYLAGLRDRFGGVVAFPTPAPAWFVDDPAAVDRVLRANAGNYTKRTVQYDALAALTGDGLLTSDNPTWREHRRAVSPAFHRRTLDRLVGAVAAAADTFDADLDARLGDRAAARVDLDTPLLDVTLDVVSRGLFSAGLGTGQAADGVAHAVVDGLEEVIRRATRPVRAPAGWPTPGNRRLARSLAVLDSAVGTVVRARAGAPPRPHPDLLDLLLAALPDARAVRDEAVTLVVAGHETVASALEWAAHLLAGDPDLQDRLAAEAAEAAAASAGAPSLATLAGLPIARAVVDETLRLYPPAWVVTRRAVAADVLAGFVLPAGALVVLSPWVRHRDPAAWPDPERFDPARFLGAPTRPDAAYLPFGLGPRLCIGREFALLEATLLVSRLARRWRLGRVDGHRAVPHPRVTVRPRGGVPLAVSRRAPG